MVPHSRYRTGDHALVRQMNLSVILHYLLDRAPISRSTLAEMSGLNKATVSSLVRELLTYNYIKETGIDSAGAGRPAVLLELNPSAGCIVSAEVGVDFISVIRTNFAAEITWRAREETRPEQGQVAILERLVALLREAIEPEGEPCSNLFGIALGVPGLVNREHGALLFAPNLGWRDVALRSLLRDTFNVPVYVENEANLAALGEHFFGAAEGYDDLVYVSVGVGLGGGIVREGRLIEGVAGYAGEFGHMTMDPTGLPCGCGNRGCWETLVSQSALFRYVRQALEEGRTSLLAEQCGGDLDRLTVPMVVDAARGGDRVARETLERIGQWLGIGIASLMNALNPGVVVLGGILSLAGDFLLPIVEEEVKRRTLSCSSSPNNVVLADNGVDACVLGGVALVYQAVLNEPVEAIRQGI